MPNIKRSVIIAGHQTSITLEEEFWLALKDIAKEKSMSINALISQIDEEENVSGENLSSAIRVFILKHYT